MASHAGDIEEAMMILNSFCQRSTPQLFPSHEMWWYAGTFDPFGSKRTNPIPIPNSRIPPHLRQGAQFCAGGDCLDVGNRVNRGHGPLEDAIGIFSKERSRFAFAQNRIKQKIGTEVDQAPAAYAHRHIPIATKATSTRVPRVVGPRPLRSRNGSPARREPVLATPKPTYHLPVWLTNFKDYEEELLAEFCPPLDNSASSTPPSSIMSGAESPSESVLESPSLSMSSPMEFVGPETDHSGGEAKSWGTEELIEKGDGGYDPFEFDNFSGGSDCVFVGSKTSAPAGCWTRGIAFGLQTLQQGRQMFARVKTHEDVELGAVAISLSPRFDRW